jgi:hypothetical protein
MSARPQQGVDLLHRELTASSPKCVRTDQRAIGDLASATAVTSPASPQAVRPTARRCCVSTSTNTSKAVGSSPVGTEHLVLSRTSPRSACALAGGVLLEVAREHPRARNERWASAATSAHVLLGIVLAPPPAPSRVEFGDPAERKGATARRAVLRMEVDENDAVHARAEHEGRSLSDVKPGALLAVASPPSWQLPVMCTSRFHRVALNPSTLPSVPTGRQDRHLTSL